VGPPVPQIALKLLRPHDGPIELGGGGWAAWEVGPREVGEVAVAGGHVLPGYLNDPEAERQNKVRDGARVWHRTGDAAWMDVDGRLWLMGRVKERVQRAGRVWWGGAAEARVVGVPELPDVLHAAYIGVPDAALGQRAVLCVETRTGALSDAEREAVVRALAPFPADEIVPLRRIPRDPRHASKTDVGALREMLTAQLGRVPAS
jgi:acyl-CoA synthetase (AMP-forming)/AMP-acid ligase II